MSIAKEILNQLGGNMFVTMTGSKDFVGGENFLQFKVGKGAAKGINFVKITLTIMDTYTVEFFKFRAAKLTPIAVREEVYNDELQAVFTQETGFYTSIGRFAK
jgi:hypothetical protein